MRLRAAPRASAAAAYAPSLVAAAVAAAAPHSTDLTQTHNTALAVAAPPPGRLVLFSFPSEKAAKEWYADPEYQKISEHRRAGTTTNFLTIVHSLPPR